MTIVLLFLLSNFNFRQQIVKKEITIQSDQPLPCNRRALTIASALGTRPRDAKLNPNTDVNSGNVISVLDLILIVKYLGM